MEAKRNLNPKLLKQIRRVEPYVPGEQPQQKVIKLNTNENPYPPSPNVARVLKEMDADRLRLYPDPSADVLTEGPCRIPWRGKRSDLCGSRIGRRTLDVFSDIF